MAKTGRILMDRNRAFWSAFLFIQFLAAALLHAEVDGFVRTRDGKTLEGIVAWVDGRVRVESEGAEAVDFRIDEIADVRFSSGPAKAVAPVAPAITSDTGRRGVLAEYYPDKEMKPLLLKRVEPLFADIYYENPEQMPDVMVGKSFAVRWTAQFQPRFSELHKFQLDVIGGARVWVDDKLLVDRWENPMHREPIGFELQMDKDKVYRFRMEFYRTHKGPHALSWIKYRNQSEGHVAMPADRLTLPPDQANAPPRVTLLSPRAGQILTSPPGVVIEAKADDPDGKVKRMHLIINGKVADAVESNVLRKEWPEILPGSFTISLRATDDKDLTVASNSISFAVGTNSGTLPQPWAMFRIGQGPKAPGGVSYSQDAFVIDNRTGDLWSRDQFDAVFQRLQGDGQIIARLESLKPQGAADVAMAGIMIRDNLSPQSSYALTCLKPSGQVAFITRGAAAGQIDRAETPSVTLPTWIKVMRHGQTVRGFFSPDGENWTLIGTSTVQIRADAYAGIFGLLCETRVTNVQIKLGAPEQAITTPGIQWRNGSVSAGRVLGLKEKGTIVEWTDLAGKVQKTPADQISRLLFAPMLEDERLRIPTGRTGVLLKGGDFVEGEIARASASDIAINSVIFGIQVFNPRENVIAVVLSDIEPSKALYEVTTADGSIHRATSMVAREEDVVIDTSTAGKLVLQSKQISRIALADQPK
jgi:hypothetical protein